MPKGRGRSFLPFPPRRLNRKTYGSRDPRSKPSFWTDLRKRNFGKSEAHHCPLISISGSRFQIAGERMGGSVWARLPGGDRRLSWQSGSDLYRFSEITPALVRGETSAVVTLFSPENNGPPCTEICAIGPLFSVLVNRGNPARSSTPRQRGR